jgi:hypothetical protein
MMHLIPSCPCVIHSKQGNSMTPSDDQFDPEKMKAQLDSDSLERAKRIAATNDWLVNWRDATLRKEIERTQSDPRFVPVQNTLDALIKQMGAWSEVQARGGVSAQRYWQRHVEPDLARLLKGPESRMAQELFREGELGRGGWEQEFFARLTGRDPEKSRFQVAFDEFGARSFSEPPPDPTPAPRPGEELGTIRQALNPPINRCRTPGFDFAVGGKADSGVAINNSFTGASLAGSGGAGAQTQAYVVMGGGASASSMIGAQFDLPQGYETLDCSATLDIDFAGFSVAGFAGSTASVNVILRAQLPDGSVSSMTQILDAIPSPFICFRSVNRSVMDFAPAIANIRLNGVAGPVRVFAGVEVFSAAAGIAGSSAAGMNAMYTLKRLCISAR